MSQNICVGGNSRKMSKMFDEYLQHVWEFYFVWWAYLLLNAASYDGEISHANACRPCAGRVGFCL